MHTKKTILFLAMFVLFAFILVSHVAAATAPDFPSCTNPQGNLKVKYDTGTHGIVGDYRTFTGSDVVYNLSANNVLQCFCPENGEGIQTTWWKINGLSESEIKDLKNQGWYYVENGSLWGLDNAAYLAKNSDYSCRKSGGGSTNGSSTSAAVGNVLGLATTGSLPMILIMLSYGVALVAAAIALKLKK